MTLLRDQTLHTAGLALCCLALVLPCAADTVVDDFEAALSPAPWTFSNGPEFPGATGSLTAGPGAGGSTKGALLSFNMTGGGNYVAMSRPVSMRLAPSNAVVIWVRCPAGVNMVLRLTDSTGQTVQYPQMTRPFNALDSAAWFRHVLSASATPSMHWGGANDGVLHGRIGGMSLLVEPRTLIHQSVKQYAVTTGSVAIDNITIADSLRNLCDPSVTPPIRPSLAPLAAGLGAQIHFSKDDRALDALSSAGFTWVRRDLHWSSVERTAGVYSFAGYDTLLNALAARGMKAHFILDYGNQIYTGSSDLMIPPTTPSALAGYGRYARASAAHFAGKDVQYEIWNEPNITRFWHPRPDPVAYAALARVGIDSVHAGDPQALVSTGGLSGMDRSFMAAVLANGGGVRANALGVHPYRRGAPEIVSDDLMVFRALAANAIPSATPTVWQTEWGYSSQSYGNGHADSTRSLQGALAVRSVLSAWLLGMPFYVYYDVRDDGLDALEWEHNLGLLTNAYADKPAMVAIRTLLAAARGRRFVGIYEPMSTNLHIVRLNGSGLSGSGDEMLVCWIDNGNATNTGCSGRPAPLALDFTHAPVSVTDHLGAALTVPASAPWTIQVGDTPVYVRFQSTGVRPGPRASARVGQRTERRVAVAGRVLRLSGEQLYDCAGRQAAGPSLRPGVYVARGRLLTGRSPQR